MDESERFIIERLRNLESVIYNLTEAQQRNVETQFAYFMEMLETIKTQSEKIAELEKAIVELQLLGR